MNTINNLNGYAFEQGYRILENKGTAIIGMSPGNGYFKKETITELLTECAKRFSKIIIMIPNQPAIHTYKALGYDDKHAEKKARLQSNALINKINESLPKILESYRSTIEIALWDGTIAKSDEYRAQYNHLLSLYGNNNRFREEMRNTTRQVIEKKIKPGSDIAQSIDEGVKYLLSELAFISSCPKISRTTVAYVYHAPWQIYENYVNGQYDHEKKDLGFVLMN